MDVHEARAESDEAEGLQGPSPGPDWGEILEFLDGLEYVPADDPLVALENEMEERPSTPPPMAEGLQGPPPDPEWAGIQEFLDGREYVPADDPSVTQGNETVERPSTPPDPEAEAEAVVPKSDPRREHGGFWDTVM